MRRMMQPCAESNARLCIWHYFQICIYKIRLASDWPTLTRCLLVFYQQLALSRPSASAWRRFVQPQVRSAWFGFASPTTAFWVTQSSPAGC